MAEIITPTNNDLLITLEQSQTNSVDTIVLITGALEAGEINSIFNYLKESIRVLKKGGLLFVQGLPYNLPEIGVYLDKFLTFKYWIAIKSALYQPTAGLPSSHAAILLFTKDGDRFNINRVRFPHEHCGYCKKPLKDWGGKTHLMHPEGYAISDVWTSLPIEDNYHRISRSVLRTILKMVGADNPALYDNDLFTNEHNPLEAPKKLIIGPKEGIDRENCKLISEPLVQYQLPGFRVTPQNSVPVKSKIKSFWDVVHHGDALELLKQYPDNSIDLVFADPPYNLEKSYNVYNDERGKESYLAWCNEWLKEYCRILKPTGSLFVLNLPHWSMYHAVFLNQYLYFQNWIVWDALSEPRGKLMPAHYGLLFYTKNPTGFNFSYDELKDIDSRQYCLRASCVRARKTAGIDPKESLTDIWSDIHRIKHRRDRDYHPCQLPDLLLERIIKLTTREGDIVLDALAGTGTTAVVASQLGRRYVAIDIDDGYVQIMREKISQVRNIGHVKRTSIHRPKGKYSKKALQIELQRIALELGRVPSKKDVEKMSSFGVEAYIETFPTWGKALKAAKLELRDSANGRS